MEPPVSIVTPVYNEAGYLAECIESVLAQTYQNWNYTIVDNCSTDGTLEVALRYAERDRRIRVHRNSQFLSVIPNHNTALRQISADCKYSKVVFGDDWIFPGCVEQMVAVAEAHPSVGIVGAYALEGQRVAWTGLEYPNSVVNGPEICRRHLLDGLHVFGSANAVLYRADLVRARDRFYNEANIHADTEICFDLLKICDFGFVHQVLTYTRVRPGSLSTLTTELDTFFPSMLQLLVKHAPDYLTREERDALLVRHVREYYRFLGKSLMLGRDEEFWNYHRTELSKAGILLSRARLAKGALEIVCMAAINPGDTVQKMLRSKRSLRRGSRIPDRAGKPDALAVKESQKASGTV
jgi:glycosyltransferase involved in cell wall biosynthesis